MSQWRLRPENRLNKTRPHRSSRTLRCLRLGEKCLSVLMVCAPVGVCPSSWGCLRRCLCVCRCQQLPDWRLANLDRWTGEIALPRELGALDGPVLSDVSFEGSAIIRAGGSTHSLLQATPDMGRTRWILILCAWTFHGAALDLEVVSLSIRALLEEPLPSLLFSASSAPLCFALPFGSGA